MSKATAPLAGLGHSLIYRHAEYTAGSSPPPLALDDLNASASIV
jgi:hypothetical protein